MIGTSGPSISTTTLSTLSPRSAASRCSAVEHSGPLASPSTVANSVAVTARTSARISRSIEPSAATRWNTIPASSSAGCKVSVTGRPEWTPMPARAVWSRSVVCLAPFINPFPRACTQAARPPTRAPAGPHFGLQLSDYPKLRKAAPRDRKSLSRLQLRPRPPSSPTHHFLPTVTLFCRNCRAKAQPIIGFTLPLAD